MLLEHISMYSQLTFDVPRKYTVEPMVSQIFLIHSVWVRKRIYPFGLGKIKETLKIYRKLQKTHVANYSVQNRKFVLFLFYDFSKAQKEHYSDVMSSCTRPFSSDIRGYIIIYLYPRSESILQPIKLSRVWTIKTSGRKSAFDRMEEGGMGGGVAL